ncbi:glycosyltransferase family 2 protein, partial [Candidatus Parcubacteria bacterium]|nr:glycosyltransferase family 2 protein [Candidatus Parcubacteria bacterium]
MKLSIIIPVYNNFKNLSRCLKSLEKQTVFNDAEIIIVDDGSDINSGSHRPDFASLIRTRDDIHTHRIEHKGAPTARNFGYSKSSGDYIFFCDADVIFLKNNALEIMIKKLEQNLDKAYCYCNYLYGWKSMPSFDFSAEKLKNNNYISTMSIIHRDALEKIKKNGPWDETLKRFQDWDLWLTMLEYNLTGIWVN